MKSLRICLTVGSVIAALVATQATHAGPIVIGNDVISRPHTNSWSNIVMNLATEVFPIYGIVTEWSVYAGDAGTLGVLIFDDGVVTGVDYEDVTEGFNNFTFEADSGTGLVEPGFTLGLWLGTATVEYSYDDGAGFGDSIEACYFDGCVSEAPVAGEAFALSAPSGHEAYRQYSVSVIDPPVPNGDVNSVPEPATLALMGLGLFGVGFARRKNKI